MKKKAFRDVIFYVASFIIILGLGLNRFDNQPIKYNPIHINQIFYLIGKEIFYYKQKADAFSIYLSIIIYLTTVAIPIAYVTYDTKKRNAFSPLNVLWILLTIGIIFYNALFFFNKDLLFSFNFRILLGEIMFLYLCAIFVCEVLSHLKEKKDGYGILSFVIKVFLYLILINNLYYKNVYIQGVHYFLLLKIDYATCLAVAIILNIFIWIGLFLSVYLIASYFEGIKNNVSRRKKLTIIRWIKIISLIAFIMQILNNGLVLVIFSDYKVIEYTPYFVSVTKMLTIIIVLIFSTILCKNLKNKSLKDTKKYIKENNKSVSNITTNTHSDIKTYVSYLDFQKLAKNKEGEEK